MKNKPKVNLYKVDDKWWWRITACNGNVIGASTEGYKNRLDCRQNMLNVSQAILDFCKDDRCS